MNNIVKSYEIRVGNLFNYPYNESVCEIAMINRYGEEIKLTDNPHGYIFEAKITLLQPIELTEEILNKLGFKYDGACFDNGKVMIGNYKDGLHYCNGYLISNKGVKIEFVHNLQNLYYAITGKDLNVDAITSPK